MRTYTVRLAQAEKGIAMTRTNVIATDADHAAALAVEAAEAETGETNFVLDGPVEEV